MACLAIVSNPVVAQEAAPRPAKVFTVSASDETLSRSYPAIVLPSREVELSFRVSGRVIELPIRGALEVAEGDVIARLDPRDFETQIAQIESSVAQAEAQLAALRTGARPEEIAAAEAALRGLAAQLQVATDNLDDATLRAPFDGIIARRDIENFTNIQAGASVGLLQALDVVHLAFDIPGPDVTALTRNGPDAIGNIARFDALPGQEFEAEIVEFSVQADSATQTYRGRVAVAVPETAVILPGMVARVVSSTPGNSAVVTVPVSALAAAPDGAPFVWIVAEDGSVSSSPVTLGEAAGANVAVTEGVQDGDTIVAAGVSRIIDGMTVRPITSVGN